MSIVTELEKLRDQLGLSPAAFDQLMAEAITEVKRRKSKKIDISLTDFKRRFWNGYQHTDFQAAIDEVLEQVAEYIITGGASGLGRVMIFMPPRHGKTMTISRMFPAWMQARKPDLRMIMASYGASLAHRNSKAVRNLIITPDYKDQFQHVTLTGKRVDAWENSSGGGVTAAGVGGAITGFGGHLIIIDDVVKGRVEAESATMRQRTKDWYTDDLLTRLEEPGGAIILMMTRWHTDDLAGWLLDQEDGDEWHVLSLPGLADDNDPLGRELDTALWPEKYGTAWMQKRREKMGSYSFSSLYQQQPIAKDAGLFDAAMIEVVDLPPARYKQKVRFYDLAVSAKKTADYSVGLLLAIGQNDQPYVVDVYRDQKRPTDTFEAIIRNALLDGEDVPIVLEADNHARAQLDFLLKDERLRNHSIKAVSPVGDKYTRAAPIASRVNAGHVNILRAAWNKAFLDELATFPAGRNDDQVDALSGAWSNLQKPAATMYGMNEWEGFDDFRGDVLGW